MSKMLLFLQLFLAILAIYSALSLGEGVNLYVPLACLVSMLIVIRLDKGKVEKKSDAQVKGQELLSAESLLQAKNELILVDAVHSLFKDLGLKISPGINYHSVDRILRLNEPNKSFGLEFLLTEGQVDKNHPKFRKALEFEKERKAEEKIILVASTHCRMPLTEREKLSDVSKELTDLLIRHHISIVTVRQLYELWQGAKGGRNNIQGIFMKLHDHPGGAFSFKDHEPASSSVS